jgi:8-oxo-dGTP pyrophosphatase MutT (NUDIX family)
VRELKEETGLSLEPHRTGYGTDDWPVYMVEIGPEEKIELSAEHDRFIWVSIERAVDKCKPERVAAPFRCLVDIEL